MSPTPAAILELARRVLKIALCFDGFQCLMIFLYALSTALRESLQLRRLQLACRPLRLRYLTAKMLPHAHRLKERGISLVDFRGMAIIDINLTHDTTHDVIASPTVPGPFLMS
jgi:hypothetical protein